MAQISRDIHIPDDLTSKDYLGFLKHRLGEQKELFHENFKNKEIE